MDSILDTIKKMLGLDSDYTAFDTDIIVGINSAIMMLTQIGIGPSEGFMITGSDEEWTDFIGNAIDREAVKTFIYERVRIVFDPPTSSFVLDALKVSSEELLWRLQMQAEYTNI